MHLRSLSHVGDPSDQEWPCTMNLGYRLPTNGNGPQVEPLCVFVLVHVVVVEGGQVAHRQRHLVVLLAQELLLDLNGLDVHLLCLLLTAKHTAPHQPRK